MEFFKHWLFSSIVTLQLSMVTDAVVLDIGMLVDTNVHFIVSQIACKLDFTG